MWHISNNPRKQEVSEIRGNRMGANLTIPIPMRDFAKLKILECSTIWSTNELDRALCTYNI